MCGIVSLIYAGESASLGQEATELLKRLEYRGYDSTGAAFIDHLGKIVLVKQVGAPSRVTRQLDIPSFRGQRFIGQVRWATYGAVTDLNSQPHLVRCKLEMVGAHNGNISNTDSLKTSLTARGHQVVSDNDGEIIVHLVEEHYASNRANPTGSLAELHRAYDAAGLGKSITDDVLMIIDAIRKAEAEAEGSYAAALADPHIPGVFAIKSGSSLYAGIGRDASGDFVVVSSDLTSVLSKTRVLIPLAEGEGIWYTEDSYLVFSLGGEPRFTVPRLKRSRLNVRDTALDPRYQYYMEQEIHAAPDTIDQVIRYYFRDPGEEHLAALLEDQRDLVKDILDQASALSGLADDQALATAFHDLIGSVDYRALSSRIRIDTQARDCLCSRTLLHSDEAQILTETGRVAPGHADALALLDLAFIWRKRRAVLRYSRELSARIRETRKCGGAVYLVAVGTSYHAALTAAWFWSGLAGVPVHPCNPGQFRKAYLDSLDDCDLVIAISQSGETKDLVDILQAIMEQRPRVGRIALVNNENSRIPQELSDFYLPILCGPEIAVAATKSFVNQLVILYLLAASYALPAERVLTMVRRARTLIADTLHLTTPALEAAATASFLQPSMHLLGTGLIGLAREGALKIREVVLNHAEGYDAAEFKHGPNTILGKNTIFSLSDIEKAIQAVESHPGQELGTIIETLFSGYPLFFICPPDERDIRITISQIHTHKIRGADIFLLAEKHPELALAVQGVPTGRPDYRSAYIELPSSGDRFLFVFGATVALQYLALRMSVLKMDYLDKRGIADHGVHPDAPKNVSKSITVD
jgi:glucosamine 6-phosphate synthetase-like amidotransferase/phosphosugar isomerase protein